MERLKLKVLLLLVVFCVSTEYCDGGSMFQALSEYVTSQLKPFVVPQTNPSKPVEVGVQIGAYAIDDVDRVRNELHIRSWLLLTWNSTITWNPADFNGLASILLPSANGFVPHVASVSSAGFHKILAPVKTRYLFDGKAIFYARVQWRLMCDMSKADECAIKLWSWAYDNSVIRLHHPRDDRVDMKKWTDSLRFEKSEYEIVSESYSQGNDTATPGSSFDWVQYDFSFRKRRTGNYYNGPMAIFRWN